MFIVQINLKIIHTSHFFSKLYKSIDWGQEIESTFKIKYDCVKKLVGMIYDREFVIEMFLDDSVSSVNRMIVATADVVHENIENIDFISNALAKEDNYIEPASLRKLPRKQSAEKPHGNFYECVLKNFTDNEYLIHFKMRKSTVEVIDMCCLNCLFYNFWLPHTLYIFSVIVEYYFEYFI